MTDSELLLAISGMLDKKLKSELQPIKSDIHDLKADVSQLKADVSNLKADVSHLKDDVSNLKADVSHMKEDIYHMKDEIYHIKLFQENVILPRLDTIESCYIDTYKRYKGYNDKMEAAFDDVELLKQVVGEHSQKLQMIS